MADVVTKELKVRCYVDAQTGQLKVFEADMDKVGKAVDKASVAMQRQEQRIQRQTNGLIKLGLATTGLNQQLGGLPNVLVEVADKFDNVSNQGVKFGSSLSAVTAKLGGLGTAALVAGAALAGWKIGRWIADITGLDKALHSLTDRLLGIGSAADSADAAFAKAMNRLAQAGITNRKLNEDIVKANIDAQNQIQEAFTSTATKLARVQGEMHQIMTRDQAKFTADENRATSKRYAELADLSAKYQIEIKQEEIQSQQERTAAAQRESAKRIKIAEDEAKKQIEMIHWAAEAIKNLAPGLTPQQKATKDWMDSFGRSVEEVTFDLNNLAPAQKETTVQFQGMQGELEETEFKVNTLAIAFFKLSNTILGISGIIHELANAIGGELGRSLENISIAVEGGAQAFTGFGQIMSGDVLGGIQNVIGGIGKLFNALENLFGHDWKKDAKNIIEAIHGISGVSQEVQDQVAQLAEEIGDADTAFILSLNDIMDSVGITTENFNQFAQATRDVFSFLERGQITAAQATDILTGAFERLLAVGTDSFGLISDKLKEIIELSKRFGLEIPAITEFLQQQATVLADSLTGLIQGITDKMGAQGIADIIKQAFAALGGGPEALAQLGDAITLIREKLKAMGLTMADVGLGFLNQLNNISKKFPEATGTINDATQALVALSNMGILTAGSFATLQKTISDSFDQINKDGKVSRAELMAISPTLALLAKLAEEYGFKLDPAIQKLIDMARKQGVLKDTDAAPSMTDNMIKLNDSLDKLNLTMENLILLMGQIPSSLPDPFRDWEIPSGGGFLQKRPPNFQGLSGVHEVTQKQEVVIVHRGEKIVGKDTGVGGSKIININIYGGNVNRLRETIKQLERDGEI